MTRHLLLWTGAWALTACQTVHVTTDTPNAHLAVDGEDLGAIPPDGLEVDVGLGFTDVPYTLTPEEGEPLSGTLARDDVSWLIAASAFSSAAVLVPVLASAAFILANPVTLNAFMVGDPGPLVVAQSRPSLLTAPAVAGAIGLGLAPLFLLLLGQSPPDEVHIAVAPAPPTAPALDEVTP